MIEKLRKEACKYKAINAVTICNKLTGAIKAEKGQNNSHKNLDIKSKVIEIKKYIKKQK